MGAQAHRMVSFQASIERESGRYMLRIFVDDLRVESTAHETLHGAVEALELRLVSGWYRDVDAFLIGGARFEDIEGALKHVRGLK